MIVRDDPENTTAMINVDNHKKHGFSKGILYYLLNRRELMWHFWKKIGFRM